MLAATMVVNEGVIPDFTKRTIEESELGCECCTKLKLELSEAVSELKYAKEIIRILQEDLDMANSFEHNTSTLSNLNRQKDQTYFQTKSSNWNKIPAHHPAWNRGETGIHQKAAVRTSNSTDILSNLKDAPDYHQSKMKRNLHHGSGIIHPNYNSNEQTSYTIPVIVCGDVQTKDNVKVINRNAFDTEDSVNGVSITKR
jgi:hypothetical protein